MLDATTDNSTPRDKGELLKFKCLYMSFACQCDKHGSERKYSFRTKCPQRPTPNLKERCVDACQKLSGCQKTEDVGFAKHIVARDEGCFHCFVSGTNREAKNGTILA
jgi:hypothetical protein